MQPHDRWSAHGRAPADLENSPSPASPPPGVRVVQSVRRAFLVLRTLEGAGRPMGLSEVARSIGASNPATLHLLRTLVLERAVTRTTSGHYELGWRLWELGSSVIRRNDLARIARFHLDELADQTGQAVLLGIREGESVLYLDRGLSRFSFSLAANAGRRSSLHGNATGKLLLAFAPSDFIDGVLSSPLRSFTARTITDPSTLRNELEAIRASGHATCEQEQELGMSSLAVGIRDHTGEVIAALTVAGPATRLTPGASEHYLGLLHAEAEAISAGLGAPPLAMR